MLRWSLLRENTPVSLVRPALGKSSRHADSGAPEPPTGPRRVSPGALDECTTVPPVDGREPGHRDEHTLRTNGRKEAAERMGEPRASCKITGEPHAPREKGLEPRRETRRGGGKYRTKVPVTCPSFLGAAPLSPGPWRRREAVDRCLEGLIFPAGTTASALWLPRARAC